MQGAYTALMKTEQLARWVGLEPTATATEAESGSRNPATAEGTQTQSSRSLAQRFWTKVDKNGPVPEHAPHLGACWVWTRGKDDKGYGQFNLNGRPRKAHIVLHGSAPPGLEWDHLCRNRACVGPTEGPPHLEAVTHKVNMHRGIGCFWQNRSAMTHCNRGHAFTPENTRIETSGSRRCRACENARARKRNPDRRDYYRDYRRAYRARRKAMTS